MKQIPMLFSQPMVKAIREELKTETRRLSTREINPGDEIWVRETHYRFGKWEKNGFTKTGKQAYKFKPTQHGIHWYDDMPDEIVKGKDQVGWFKRPSLFMPYTDCRIKLRVIRTRVEQLQKISAADCLAEGIESKYDIEELNHPNNLDYCIELIQKYRALWNSLNKKPGTRWEDNPKVRVIEFFPGLGEAR